MFMGLSNIHALFNFFFFSVSTGVEVKLLENVGFKQI